MYHNCSFCVCVRKMVVSDAFTYGILYSLRYSQTAFNVTFLKWIATPGRAHSKPTARKRMSSQMEKLRRLVSPTIVPIWICTQPLDTRDGTIHLIPATCTSARFPWVKAGSAVICNTLLLNAQNLNTKNRIKNPIIGHTFRQGFLFSIESAKIKIVRAYQRVRLRWLKISAWNGRLEIFPMSMSADFGGGKTNDHHHWVHMYLYRCIHKHYCVCAKLKLLLNRFTPIARVHLHWKCIGMI